MSKQKGSTCNHVFVVSQWVMQANNQRAAAFYCEKCLMIAQNARDLVKEMDYEKVSGKDAG